MVVQSKKNLTLGQALSFAFRNALSHFFSFLGITSVAFGLMCILLVPIALVVGRDLYQALVKVVLEQGISYGEAFNISIKQMSFSFPVKFLLVVSLVLVYSVAFWFMAALIKKGCSIYDEKKVSIIGAYTISPAILWRLVFGVFAYIFFIGLFLVSFSLPTLFLFGFLGNAYGWLFLLYLVLAFLLICLAIVVWVRVSFPFMMVFYCIIDGPYNSFWSAFLKSYALLRGNTMRLFWYFFVLSMVNFVLSFGFLLFNAALPIIFTIFFMQPVFILFWAYVYKRLSLVQ